MYKPRPDMDEVAALISDKLLFELTRARRISQALATDLVREKRLLKKERENAALNREGKDRERDRERAMAERTHRENANAANSAGSGAADAAAAAAAATAAAQQQQQTENPYPSDGNAKKRFFI